MNKANMSIRQILFKKVGAMPLLALSFALVIFVGTLFLCLPITNIGTPQSFLNNLFVATSATCVTGLVPYAVVDQYNMLGQVVLICLMQVGGLGLMTLLSLMMSLMKHKLFIGEKKLIQDSLGKSDLQDIPRFIRCIVIYTLVFETIGAILFALKFVPEYGWFHGIFNSIFLSVSAFCNAGLDNILPNSLISFVNDPLINFTVAGLIITGGLGFVVWLDLRKHLSDLFGKNGSFKKLLNKLSVHTKVVLIMTGFLLLSGTLLIYALEYNNPNTLGPLSEGSKWMASFFQSTTLRTAGFATLPIAALKPATQFIMCLYMFIGGSPGGTAGGIKTTTFAMLFIFVLFVLRNDSHINVMKRDIPRINFMKAYVVTIIYLTSLVIAIIILSITENVSFLAIIFECFSAIATVGLSMDVTPLLSSIGKIVIILLMFIGRVGPITIVVLIFRVNSKVKPKDISYSHGDILIG
ncbi:TrkH family potassium uptake protein [Anaerorhabdus furcosa]|uniref:Trk system potassium uptake protein TrkH n=1 Tax=Anaerorhabdus furcosa TaxID=118967 RepID=A0A1T4QD16_9FIRM|nr:potassium transporter TrkG [Anaerorhabdus furcosa]SKA01632.1 trk system potassium uptake protein TrkH [Anaerorhabdus furcosa]